MTEQQPAICVSDLSKVYKLYDRNRDRVMDALGLSKKKRYREHYALSHVSFSIQRGETVGIIGSNGAGKSTILKIITGVLNPTEGEVSVHGRISALLELGAGFNQEYTGIENIYLNGTMMGYSREEIDARMDAIVEFADIGDFIRQPVKMYSSGMFVRLAFAVAINIDPDILVVDEALSVGDVFFQSKCYKKFDEFKEQGKTILFVSHDLSSISRYCDRAILLNRGKMMAEGSPTAMIDLYKKVRANQVDEKGQDLRTEQGREEETPGQELWKNHFDRNPNQQDYGDRRAEIIDYALTDEKGLLTASLIKDQPFSIRMKLRFHEPLDFPIAAFTIRTLKGADVTGTNTWYEHISFAHEAGSERTVTITQNMSLQGGEYFLSLGCTGFHNGELEVYHRLYDALHFTVISDKDTLGYFDMNSTVTVE